MKKIALLIVMTLICAGLGGRPLFAQEASWQMEITNYSQMLENQYWRIPKNSVTVGILSTGIDLKNPLYQNNLWGQDVLHPCCGWNFVENNNNPHSTQEQGNWIASFLVKTAPNVKIAAFRVTATKSIGASQFNRALEYAGTYGIKILLVAAPIGGCYTCDGTYEAVQKYLSLGGILICTAGDESISDDIYPIQPGSYDLKNIITVAACNKNGYKTTESNYGQESVHVFAPGKDLEMPVSNNKTYVLNGTDAAAAWVTSMVTIALGVNPDLTFSELRNLILESVNKNYLNLKDQCSTGGIIDFDMMYQKVIGEMLIQTYCYNGYVIEKKYNRVFEEVKAIAIPYAPLEGMHTVYFYSENPLKTAYETVGKLPSGNQCSTCNETKPTD